MFALVLVFAHSALSTDSFLYYHLCLVIVVLLFHELNVIEDFIISVSCDPPPESVILDH